MQLPNGRPLRAAFFDIDGTLVNSKGTIGPTTSQEIEQLRRSGVRVGLASGRPEFGASRVIADLSITDPCMFFSGALVCLPGAASSPLLEVSLEGSEVHTLIEALTTQQLYFELYSRSEYFIESDHPLAEMHAGYLHRYPAIAPFKDVIAQNPILKLVAALESPAQEQAMRTLLSRMPQVHCAFSKGATHDDILFANITSVKATRDHAFRALLAACNVSAEETLAVGDAEADIPFLQLAGWGLAMANAPLAVQQRANEVCGSVEQDGLGEWLKKLRASA